MEILRLTLHECVIGCNKFSLMRSAIHSNACFRKDIYQLLAMCGRIKNYYSLPCSVMNVFMLSRMLQWMLIPASPSFREDDLGSQTNGKEAVCLPGCYEVYVE